MSKDKLMLTCSIAVENHFQNWYVSLTSVEARRKTYEIRRRKW